MGAAAQEGSLRAPNALCLIQILHVAAPPSCQYASPCQSSKNGAKERKQGPEQLVLALITTKRGARLVVLTPVTLPDQTCVKA